jgi:hypothetical protein
MLYSTHLPEKRDSLTTGQKAQRGRWQDGLRLLTTEPLTNARMRGLQDFSQFL